MDYDWTVLKRPTKYGQITDVEQTYLLRGHGLPGYGYVVTVNVNGYINSRSCPGSCGGVRYYGWGNQDDPKNLWAALDHGMKWAKRHARQIARGHVSGF
jgi:hypothetical protein